MSTLSISTTLPRLDERAQMLMVYCLRYQAEYGQVTKFSKKYGVSRQTIYNIKAAYPCVSQNTSEITSYCATKAALKAEILSLRMEGCVSLSGIQKIIKRSGAVCDSIGFISQTLTEWGQIAGNDLGVALDVETISVVYAADEIYAGSAPILMVVDPRSLAVLRIELCTDRSSATWERLLGALTNQSIRPDLIVKDDGTGMEAAFRKLMPDVAQQTDTFHAVAHRLGEYKHRYERAAYRAIQAEYDAEAQYYKAKSDEVRHKYYEIYFIAKAKADAAITLYDHFCFLYHTLLNAFQVFDYQGNLKNSTRVITDFDTALALIPTLQHPNSAKIDRTVQSIRACQPKLFTFLQTAKTVIQTLAQTIDAWVLKPLCLAWQAHKNTLKAKDKRRKAAQTLTEKNALREAQFLLTTDLQAIKTQVYTQLNTIIQSSAAVECINSLLRPYLNTLRNQVSQETLNLFMFYHNHHAFNQGERKGKSPMQILTGHQHKDWIELLYNKI
jgi:Transposase, Mutator family